MRVNGGRILLKPLCNVLQSVYFFQRHIGTVPFHSRFLSSIIDTISRNEACRVSRCAHILSSFLHRDSTLFLRVHGHVRFLYLSFLCDLPYSCYPSLNSRDTLRAALDIQEVVLGTIPKISLSDTAGTCGVRVTTETSSNTAVSKTLPPAPDSSHSSYSGTIAFDIEKYPVFSVPAILTGRDKE